MRSTHQRYLNIGPGNITTKIPMATLINKTDRHNITEILLKVALNNKPLSFWYSDYTGYLRKKNQFNYFEKNKFFNHANLIG